MYLIDLIGNTPLVNVACDGNLALLLKLEGRNPGGSAKDRTALFLIQNAERQGLLRKNGTIIAATSGNFGISLAWIGSVLGYGVILTMPENMSVERWRLLHAYGAQTVLTDSEKSMAGAIEEARRLAAEQPEAVLLDQFSDPANPLAHYRTTGPELWRDTDGKIDALVAGVGSGGTLCGAGRYLKEKDPAVQIIAVEPDGSPVLSGGTPGPHGIQGIGAGFVPSTTDTTLFDRIIPVSDRNAMETARELARKHGVMTGFSGGASVWAAKKFAQDVKDCGKNIVVILPDAGERYLSTALFS